MFVSHLDPGVAVSHPLGDGRGVYLYVIEGDVTVNGERMATGDAAEIEREPEVAIVATSALRAHPGRRAALSPSRGRCSDPSVRSASYAEGRVFRPIDVARGPADDGGGDPGTPLTMPGRTATREGYDPPFVPWSRRAPARRRGAADPRRLRCPWPPQRPGSRAGVGRRRRTVAVRRRWTHPRVTGGAPSHRRERGSAGPRLHGSEPAPVRTASVRALGERDVRRAAPRSTATATGFPIRSTRRSMRSRRHGGSRSCAWGSARRSPTGARPTTVRTTSWTSTWRMWARSA